MARPPSRRSLAWASLLVVMAVVVVVGVVPACTGDSGDRPRAEVPPGPPVTAATGRLLSGAPAHTFATWAEGLPPEVTLDPATAATISGPGVAWRLRGVAWVDQATVAGMTLTAGPGEHLLVIEVDPASTPLSPGTAVVLESAASPLKRGVSNGVTGGGLDRTPTSQFRVLIAPIPDHERPITLVVRSPDAGPAQLVLPD